MTPSRRPVRVGFVSLGCPKNLVDSEVMLGTLRDEGMLITPDAAEAEVIVVNTCGFIEAAREESIDTILEMARLKTEGACRRLVVAGCLVQRHASELREELPEVDAFLGLDDLGRVAEAVRGERGDDRIPHGGPATFLYDHQTPRMLAGPRHSAYLKIAEGCDNPCAFCAIPRFRGAFRSRRMGSILAEAEALVRGGAVELNLIAQDSTYYGVDLGLEDGTAKLLEALSEIEGARWIRLFYVYPNRISDRLIEVMATRDNVCRYVDIPLQHASRSVLQRMVRGGSAAHHREVLRRFRERIPGVHLRTTMIVGYPGETDAEFQELLDFVEEAAFDHL
ncbi:MAG: 30S ribosomal protein S12 methylthiotransferase RimO, partial [Acidobacteriota bacterium]